MIVLYGNGYIYLNPMSLLGGICGALLAYALVMVLGFYQIKEGQVGLIKEWGVLKSQLIQPGFHFRIPGMQEVIRMDLMIQTDKVERVPCGTANGLLVTFDKIQVVNRLQRRQVYRTVLNYTEQYEKIWITDKIHHEINQFCSKHTLQEIYIDLFDRLDEELMKALSSDIKKWAPGIEILSVRVTKPTIPKKILQNVEEMEKIKVEYLIAIERERTAVEERRTNQSQAKIKAEADLSVKRIELGKLLDRKKNELKMAKIEAEIIVEREKSRVNAEFLAAFAQAELYPELYTDQYLRYLAGEALTSNLTITAGSQVPNIVSSLKEPRKK